MDKKQFILNYQFPIQMKARVKERLKCNDFHILCMEDALKDYFLARYEYLNTNQPVTMPSVSVDELWHEFIIFTRDYHSFCDIVFGQYLHHDPYGKFNIRKSDDIGLQNILVFLRKNKVNRKYNSEDINLLNEAVNDFHLLFAMDYIIHNNSYDIVVVESLKDIKRGE